MARKIAPLHVLFAAAAGIGTFLVAAKFSPGAGDSADTIEVAAPRAARSPRPASGVIAPAPRPAASAAGADGAALAAGDRDKVLPASQIDLFNAKSWLPPPPPPPPLPPPAPPPGPPPPPPAPVAPTMPYAFVGMVERGTDKPQAFLSRGETLVVVAVGDVIDNTYRVDSLTAKAVVLTYLPLGKQQTIQVPGASQ